MTAHVRADAAPSAAPPVVLLGRSPAAHRLVERAAAQVRSYGSAMEALLSLAQDRPRAIVLCPADFEGREDALLAAIRRAQPGVPIYVLVPPEDEPLGRRLVEGGAADYALLPDGLEDLRAMLAGGPDAARRTPVETEAYLAGGGGPRTADAAPPPSTSRTPSDPGPTPPAAQAGPLFDAACALAGLAALDPAELLQKGGRIIQEAAGSERGSVFLWDAGAGRLQPRPGPGAEDGPTADEQALAERAVRTGETLLVAPASGPPPEGASPGAGRAVLCVPVRVGGDAFGAICLAGAAWGGRHGAAVRAAVEALARALAHLAQAAARRP